MAARRVMTEQTYEIAKRHQGEDVDEGVYNLDELSDDNDDDHHRNNKQQRQKQNDNKGKNQGGGGVDDLINYKGIYYGDDTQKYTDPENGAHFEFRDMCRRLQKIQVKREAYEKTLSIDSSTDKNNILDKGQSLLKEKEELLRNFGAS